MRFSARELMLIPQMRRRQRAKPQIPAADRNILVEMPL
jgi:hypothetical protein